MSIMTIPMIAPICGFLFAGCVWGEYQSVLFMCFYQICLAILLGKLYTLKRKLYCAN